MLLRTCKQCKVDKEFTTKHWLSNYGVPYGTICRACYNEKTKLRQAQKRATPDGAIKTKQYRKTFYEKSRQNFIDSRIPPAKRGRPPAQTQNLVPVIYSLTWENNPARYVGKTTNLARRMREHARIHTNWRLHTAYAQLGLPIVTVLEHVANEVDLVARERYWIDQLDSTNIDTGGLNIH